MLQSSGKKQGGEMPASRLSERKIVCPHCGKIVSPINRGKIRDLRIIYYPCCKTKDGIW